MLYGLIRHLTGRAKTTKYCYPYDFLHMPAGIKDDVNNVNDVSNVRLINRLHCPFMKTLLASLTLLTL